MGYTHAMYKTLFYCEGFKHSHCPFSKSVIADFYIAVNRQGFGPVS